MASNSFNSTNVREAKEAMTRRKREVANEFGVPLSNGYIRKLNLCTERVVGGYMIKKEIEAELHQQG